MTEKTTHLRVRLGDAEVEYDGDQEFLKEQVMPTVDKIIEMVDGRSKLQAPKPVLQLNAAPSVETPEEKKAADSSAGKSNGSLSSFLKTTGGDSNQTRRFLATAAWLRGRGQVGDLTTSMVAKALQENHQKKITNASDCLNKNCEKGYCEKTKAGFFVTEEGKTALGLNL
jgi:hypothetical protein